jgi:preprotein translocase subunit SecE
VTFDTAKRRFRFLAEIYSELKKVVWLSRREVVYLSIMVVIVSVAAGVLLGGLDYTFSVLVEKVFLGK